MPFAIMDRNIGVVGAGVIGLTCALVLAEAGYGVTVLARELPGDNSKKWASPWAGAGILPHPDTGGHDLQTNTFVYFWALAHNDPTSGVQVVDVTEYYDDRSDDSTIWYKQIAPKYRRLQSKDLPAGARIGFQYQSTTVNPQVFLPWIKNLLDKKGVRFVQKEIRSINDARAILKTSLIINCSGLGASDLVPDRKVQPVRGQIVLVKGESDEMILYQGSHYTYQIPRMFSGGTIIGGIAQEGSTDHAVDLDLRNDILQRVNLVTRGRYKDLDLSKDIIQDLVGFRPSRKGGYRLEKEKGVVHAYGFGSLGYTYCYGVALRVRELVEASISLRRSQL
ncbi:hypothetical protein CNMCM8694_002085 [Aspergillus lentulus]|nr:hypothetical protein CNMCM8060_002427 [Aspergillus lentulus]KAF4191280.1 hypothetical protein CNMCM8694_002085 [Aspergillus lentulus]